MSKNTKRNISPYIALIFVLAAIYFLSTMIDTKVNNISYSTFKKNLASNKVELVEVSPNSKGSVYEITDKLKNYDNKESFYTTAPFSDETINLINEYQSQNNFKVKISADPTSSLFFTFVANVLHYILLE